MFKMYRLNYRRRTLPQRLSSNSPMTMRELERIALLRRNRGNGSKTISSYVGCCNESITTNTTTITTTNTNSIKEINKENLEN
ncbi:hypothetical protein Mgra_00005967, partial [Meloidogyne graminicola]